jgi:hypothetical protein
MGGRWDWKVIAKRGVEGAYQISRAKVVECGGNYQVPTM